MEKYNFEDDVKVFCQTADSFPEGILKAHQSLHDIVPFSTQRKYFGISYPERDGSIIYKAAASELAEGELSGLGLEIFTIPKGQYLSHTIPDYKQNISAIGETFRELIARPEIDPNGFCLEWYVNNDDCKCMVKTIDEI